MTFKTELNLINDDINVNTLTATNIYGALIGDGSSLSNLKLSAQSVAVRSFLFADNTINDSLTFIQKNVFPVTSSLELNNGSFTSSASGITVPSSGYYVAVVSIRQDSNVQRSSVQVAFTINGTVQSEIGSSGYIRSANDHNESSVHLSTIYNLVSGDEIGLAFRRDPDGGQGATGTVNLVNTSQVSLYNIN